jgi:2-C-methyl-D-erythritol 4-phosphate cytidylyltransferase
VRTSVRAAGRYARRMSFRSPSAPRVALVLLAAGEGRRVGQDTNKVLLPLGGRPVFTWCVRTAGALVDTGPIVLVVRAGEEAEVEAALVRELPDLDVTVVVGGSSRHASEWHALTALGPTIERGDVDVVVIHDAARPLASARLFDEVVSTAAEHGGALPVVDQPALAPVDPADPPVTQRVVAVQTPQAFLAAPLLRAYAAADAQGFVGTDTASCVERFTDVPVLCVEGDARNIKITFAEDFALAEGLLRSSGQGR